MPSTLSLPWQQDDGRDYGLAGVEDRPELQLKLKWDHLEQWGGSGGEGEPDKCGAGRAADGRGELREAWLPLPEARGDGWSLEKRQKGRSGADSHEEVWYVSDWRCC